MRRPRGTGFTGPRTPHVHMCMCMHMYMCRRFRLILYAVHASEFASLKKRGGGGEYTVRRDRDRKIEKRADTNCAADEPEGSFRGPAVRKLAATQPQALWRMGLRRPLASGRDRRPRPPPPTTFAVKKQNRLSLLSTDPLRNPALILPALSVYGKHITAAVIVSLSTLSHYLLHHYCTRHPWAQKDAVRRQEPSFHCPSPDGGPASSPIPTNPVHCRPGAVHTCRRLATTICLSESAPAADAQSGS